jgi:hypothetical protein
LTAEIAEEFAEFAEFAEKIFLRVLVETPAPPAFCRNALERKQPPGWSRLLVFFSTTTFSSGLLAFSSTLAS